MCFSISSTSSRPTNNDFYFISFFVCYARVRPWWSVLILFLISSGHMPARSCISIRLSLFVCLCLPHKLFTPTTARLIQNSIFTFYFLPHANHCRRFWILTQCRLPILDGVCSFTNCAASVTVIIVIVSIYLFLCVVFSAYSNIWFRRLIFVFCVCVYWSDVRNP